MIAETIEALFKAALPVGALGYLLMYWSIKSGRLTGDGDVRAMRAELKAMKQERKAGHKAARVEKKMEKKALKAQRKAEKKAAKMAKRAARKSGEALPHRSDKEKEKLSRRIADTLIRNLKPTGNPVHDKWMKFGGGFYGVMALWTYVVIELQEIYQFLMAFTGLSGLVDRLSLDLLIGFFVNSLINFIRAIIWFAYWPEVLNTGRILLWLIMAYAGYLGGLQLARQRWPARLWG